MGETTQPTAFGAEERRLIEAYRALLMGHANFRKRHEQTPRFKHSRRRQVQMIGCYADRVGMARKYLAIARKELGRPVRLMACAEHYQALRRLQDAQQVAA